MISLCVPTRGRPDRFRSMVESTRRTARGKIEVVAWLDDDDPTKDRYPQDLGVVYGSGPRPLRGRDIQMSGLWTKTWGLATGDLAMLLGDDVIFETSGWDRKIARAFAGVPDRILMVYPNDGHGDRARPVMPIVSREWIDAAGFVPDDLQGWFSDEWIWCLAAEVGRAAFLRDVVVRHNQWPGADPTYREAYETRQRAGGLAAMREAFYTPSMVARRDDAVAKLRDVMTSPQQIAPQPIPDWYTLSIRLAHEARRNQDTLVVIHCWKGDEELVRNALPVHQAHGCPILVLSPKDSPVVIDEPGVECRSAGKRGYYGQDSLDRQRAHLEILLEYPQRFFLLNDADSMCLAADIPGYLYAKSDRTVWSNEVKEPRPHKSPYPKIAMQPPYFLRRETIAALLEVADRPEVKAHPITPYIDWYMLALVEEAGLAHKSFPDGASFPAWKRNRIGETQKLGHDFVHEYDRRGNIDGETLMIYRVKLGTVLIHSVKHKRVLDRLVAARADYTKPGRTRLPRIDDNNTGHQVLVREFMGPV